MLNRILGLQAWKKRTSGGPLPLRLNFTWTFVGNLVYAACQWGMLTVLAKLGSPEMVGQFSLALAVTAPVVMLADLQLRAVQATDAETHYSFGQYFTLRVLMIIAGFLAILGIVGWSDYSGATAKIVLVIGVAKSFEAMSDIIYGLLQKCEQMDRIAISMMSKGMISLTALAITVWITHNVLWGSVALASSWLLVLLIYDFRSAQRLTVLRLEWNRYHLWSLFKLSFPLGVVMMLISLNTNIPRYFVENRWGEAELGYFSAAAYLMVAGSMIVRALGQSAAPRLSKYQVGGDTKGFRLLLNRLLLIGAVLGSGVIIFSMVFGRYVLTILYKPDYAQYAYVLVWLMVAGAIGYLASFLGYAMTALHRFKVQLPLFMWVVAGTAVGSALLIPAYGVVGAAYAMIVGASVNLIGSAGIVIFALKSLEGKKDHATE